MRRHGDCEDRSSGVLLQARDNKGNTALVRAGQHGHANVAAVLLAAGADVTSRNESGEDCATRAMSGGHQAVLALISYRE